MSNFGLGIVMISIFSSVRTVAIGGIVLKFASYYLRYAISSSTPMTWRLVSSIIPPLNLFNVNYGIWVLQAFDSLSFSTVTEVNRHYSFAAFLVMSLVSFVFWTAFGLYISYILPTEFGTRKHP